MAAHLVKVPSLLCFRRMVQAPFAKQHQKIWCTSLVGVHPVQELWPPPFSQWGLIKAGEGVPLANLSHRKASPPFGCLDNMAEDYARETCYVNRSSLVFCQSHCPAGCKKLTPEE